MAVAQRRAAQECRARLPDEKGTEMRVPMLYGIQWVNAARGSPMRRGLK